MIPILLLTAFVSFNVFGGIFDRLEINRLHMRVILDELRDFRAQIEPKQTIEAQPQDVQATETIEAQPQDVQATETIEAQPQDVQTVETTILAEATVLPEITGTFCNKVTIYCEKA